MFLLSYHLDAAHLVVELGEVVDLDNESTIEREITRLLPCCGPRALIVDIRTPLLTSRALGLLLRIRGRCQERGISMAVVAGYDTAREVLSAAGLNRVLRVAPTLRGAESRSQGCGPRPAASPDGKGGDRHGATPSRRPSERPIGPHADTSRPRFPGKR